MRKAIVLIADIVRSREMKTRATVQEQLAGTLQSIATANKSTMLSPLTITLGDEFQAVYTTATGLIAQLLTITAQLYPVQLRYSVAAGTIVTKINYQYAIGMDGPAFYAAREGMQHLKDNGGVLYLCGPKGQQAEAMHHITALLNTCISNWGKSQYAITSGLLSGHKVPVIATAAGISPQAVYKHISTHGLHAIAGALAALETMLNTTLQATIHYNREHHDRQLRVADNP